MLQNKTVKLSLIIKQGIKKMPSMIETQTTPYIEEINSSIKSSGNTNFK